MNFAEFGVVQIGIFVCQPLAFDFGSHHERVHRPTEALLPARRLFAADDTASSNWSAAAYALSTAAFAIILPDDFFQQMASWPTIVA